MLQGNPPVEDHTEDQPLCKFKQLIDMAIEEGKAAKKKVWPPVSIFEPLNLM
jgi:hypothetical protein